MSDPIPLAGTDDWEALRGTAVAEFVEGLGGGDTLVGGAGTTIGWQDPGYR